MDQFLLYLNKETEARREKVALELRRLERVLGPRPTLEVPAKSQLNRGRYEVVPVR